MTVHVKFNGTTLCNRHLKGYQMERFVSSAFRCGTCEQKLKKKGYDLKDLEKRYKPAPDC